MNLLFFSCYSLAKQGVQDRTVYFGNGNQLLSNCNFSNNNLQNSILYTDNSDQNTINSCYFYNNYYYDTTDSIYITPSSVSSILESNFINNSNTYKLSTLSKIVHCSFYSFGKNINFAIHPHYIIDCYFSDTISGLNSLTFFSSKTISQTRNLPNLIQTYICVTFPLYQPSTINLGSLNLYSLISPNLIVSIFSILINS